MNMNPFDPNKPFTTRDGRPARLISLNGKGIQPIIAVITERDGKDVASYHYADGGFWKSGAGSCAADLINIPEPKKWRAWATVSEVPVGALVRYKHNREWVSLICCATTFESELMIHGGHYKGDSHYNQSAHVVFDSWEVSLDHGKTWQPCGVEE